MKKCYIIVFLALFNFISESIKAQVDWAWVSGDTTVQSNPVGVKGVPSILSKPGSRSNHCFNSDNAGNLYVFGGMGYSFGNNGLLNDLWKYKIATNEWTWLSGDTLKNSFGNYGLQGIPSATNVPGARNDASMWTDQNNNIWVFGGNGFTDNNGVDYLNDLWKYDVLTGQWTWMKGDNLLNSRGIYGVKGASSATNTPGARVYAATWTGNDGNLWLFGGRTSYNNYVNDVWKYDITLNQWTWVSGDSVANGNPSYGVFRQPSATNKPGPRKSTSYCKDDNGNFWIFGGDLPHFAIGSVRTVANDLWKFDPITIEWTWMAGQRSDSAGVNTSPIHVCKGIAASTNRPAGDGNGCAWSENSNIWLFSPILFGYNDLWRYDMITNQWSWESGDPDGLNENPVNGVKGVFSINNIPGGRYSPKSAKDINGTTFLFGGLSRLSAPYTIIDYVNDLWKFRFDSSIFANLPSISISTSNNSICTNSNAVFSAVQINGGTSPIYQWKKNGVNVGNSSATFSSNSLANGDIITCQLTSNLPCVSSTPVTSNSIVIKVIQSIKPTISIINSSNNVCSGSSITFTANAANGGTSPQFNWKINGNNIGSNSSTFTDNSLINGDVVSCSFTSNASCASPTTVVSNTILISIFSPVTPAINVTSSQSTICLGTNILFTATTVNGGVAPAFQWKVNGINVGTNNATFSSSALMNGDQVSCTLISNAPCINNNGVTSNSIVITVTQSVLPTITISSASNNICTGSVTSFSTSILNGGVNPAYQWKLNGLNVGSNSSTYSSGSLVNNDVISCILISTSSCASPSQATSNNIIMSVNTVLVPSLTIAALSSTACSGDLISFTANPVNQGVNPIFQWKVNGVNTGSNSLTYTSKTFVNGDIVSCVLTSNAACAMPVSASSNEVKVIINTSVVPSISIISSANNVCPGSQVTFTAIPINGGTKPAYQWMINGNNSGTNSNTFSTNMLKNGDIISCVLTSNSSCASQLTVFSNDVMMVVNTTTTPSINITASATVICDGGVVTFNATAINEGSIPKYQWKVNGINANSNTTSYITNTLKENDVITCELISNSACALGTQVISNSITIQVSSLLTPSINITASHNNVCPGSLITFTASATDAGNSPSYQWQLNGKNVGNNSSTYSSLALINGDMIKCKMLSNAACASNIQTTSNGIIVGVVPAVDASVSITSSTNSICAGDLVSFAAISVNGGNSPSYQWQVNGISVESNKELFTTSFLKNNDVISCIMSSSLPCSSPAASDNSITINVDPLPSISLGPDKTITIGESIQLEPIITGSVNNYLWSPSTGLDNPNIENPIATPSTTVFYKLNVTSINGCKNSADIAVKVVDNTFGVPNAFTPNEDGLNDIFYITGTRNVKIVKSFSVFNRWGEKVFKVTNIPSNNPTYGWNGFYKGKEADVGTYIYVATVVYDNGKQQVLKGTVTLIR